MTHRDSLTQPITRSMTTYTLTFDLRSYGSQAYAPLERYASRFGFGRNARSNVWFKSPKSLLEVCEDIASLLHPDDTFWVMTPDGRCLGQAGKWDPPNANA
jgi:hypothetical protein